jgi:hypothetical protein
MKRIFGIGCLLLATTMAMAQSDFGVWTNIEGSTKLNKSLELSLEGEFRTQEMSAVVERIATGISLSYKNKKVPFLKADVGYSVMSMYGLSESNTKYLTDDDDNYVLGDDGNLIPKHENRDAAYWYTRHRATVSLTGSVKWGRFKFSLRERYQFTHRMRSYCDRYRYYYYESLKKWDYELSDFEQPEQLTDEKKSKSDHKLRSRLAVSYDIKKCPFEPFAEVEVYNELDNHFAFNKVRYTIGTEYKINKEHKLKLYYRYQDYADIDEVSGHILGLGYAFEF